MIRDVKSKLPDNAATTRTMNYILEKAELVGGSEAKFDNTSMKEYAEFGAKKFRQINNKYQSKTGRTQEIEAVHEIISFHTDDKVSPEMARDLALTVWRNVLDLDNRKHRWAVHTDTDEIHVHLVWNKRDNKGNLYNQHNDYAFFEKACQEIEEEYGLKVVENRKSLNPGMPTSPKPSNEYRLENRGIKSEKKKFKEAVNAVTDKAMTAGEFLEFLDADGFTLITNGNNAYSLEKDGQIFKASEVGASYKALKARFGDDPQFGDTLARLGVKTAPVRDYGSIGGDFHDEQSSITEKRIKKSNRVLDTRFDTPDGHDFYYKGTNKKAFEYSDGTATFNTTSPMAIKAGLQKLTESGKPQTLHLTGTHDFKRNAWLQFQMMGLDQKGYSLSGFTPNANDKAELEKLKLENPAFKKPIEAISVTSSPTNKPAKKPHPTTPVKKAVDHLEDPKLKSFIRPVNADDDTKAKRLGKIGAVGIADGLVKTADVFAVHDAAGSMNEKLSEMRVLAAQAKNSQSSSENEAYQNEKRRRQQLRPD
ncbi:relaxase/mobilization nuclease domain-containing protein [Pseudomonas helleri]|uniref:relaxase/mobilization nuclease domain-containing protein n=1 Tax=Pseudomonas TaxID=286 RepID=UPI0012958B7C|nr:MULTISPECIES: relaxase/mobilization nuclease domain-containing protein [Pseudomonas]MBJ2285504.1 relaxase/mobilization nuclease domain-containing protein [Pseudomonas sp. MF6755]MQU57014.1 relaxase/mobilization nuclease domain-containing protein [Pseudomonas helleri]